MILYFTDKKVEKTMPIILKRGQRGKLKRIKEKYKDQDEDERDMRIKLLQVIWIKNNNYLGSKYQYKIEL